MAAGDVSTALETRVRHLAGDNASSFTQARIMSWMTEAQMDLIRRLPPDIIPELTEQVVGLLAADGTATKPSDYVKPIEARYGACGYHAAFKPLVALRYQQQRTYMAATCVEPNWTFENEKLAFFPATAECYKLDYVKTPCADIASNVDPEIPIRFRDALVFYAASKCEERQKAFDEANTHMTQYERCLALWGGTPK